jgi:plastocyanin
MSNRLWPRAVAAALTLAVALTAATAVAKAPNKAPKNATLQIKGKMSVKRNAFFRDGAHFAPGVVSISSGGTLTIKNRSEEPHTFSIVKKSDLPKTTKKMLTCGGPGTICDTIFTAHEFDQTGNPQKPIVDVGAPGIDQVGDSIVMNPKSTQKVKVSAPKGTTLHFICGFHAWMQGQLRSR